MSKPIIKWIGGKNQIKDKILKTSNIEDLVATQEHDDDAQFQQQFLEYLDQYNFVNDN